MADCPLCKSSSCDIVDQFSASQLRHIAPRKYRPILRDILRDVSTFAVMRCKQCHLLHFDPVVSGSDQFYSLLSKEAFYYMKDKPEYELVRPYLPEPLRLLEVGCGVGHFVEKLQGRLDRYHGLEFNPDAVKAARKHGLSVTSKMVEEYAQSHAGEFNAVGSFQVLEHVADVHSFIDASLACLENDGIFFFSVPNQDSFVGQAADEFLNLPPHHLTRWPRATVEALADIFSLELVAVAEEELADYHVSFYVRTCYWNGLGKQRNEPNRCVSSRAIKNGLITKCFNKFFVNPILTSVASGMESFKPRCKGHTILGIYRKRQPQ